MVGKEQDSPQSPCVEHWPRGMGSRGGINRTFVWPRAEEHMAQAQAHLPLSVLDLSVAPTLPPSVESLPVNQSCPALPVTPFR